MSYTGHNGKPIVERVATDDARGRIEGLARVPISKATAHEVISLSYGFFTPLTGFMGRQAVDGTLDNFALPDGTLWSIPIVFDMSADDIAELDIKEGASVVLDYLRAPWPSSTSPRSTNTTSSAWPKNLRHNRSPTPRGEEDHGL